MKLPAGKLLKTVPGGMESISSLFDEFQGDKFSGYISTNLDAGGSQSLGQLVFKEGAPILSEHIAGKKTISGKAALLPLLTDGLKEDAFIEIHGNIDVDLMALYFQKAKVESEEFDLDTLIKDVQEYEKRAAEEHGEKAELQARIDEWKGEGLDVSSLEDLMGGSLKDLQKGTDTYEKNLKKLVKLKAELEGFREALPQEVEAAEGLLNDPANAATLEKAIKSLTSKAEENEERKEGLLKKVGEWKEQGYEVAKLEEVISRNVDEGWELFTTYMDSIPKLDEMGKFLGKVDGNDLPDGEMDRLLALFKNPEEISAAQDALGGLKDKLEASKQKRGEAKAKVDGWKSEGYKVSRLKGVQKMPLSEMEEALAKFEADLNNLSDLHTKFMSMEVVGLADDVAKFEEFVKDPDAIAEAATLLEEIDSKLKEINLRKQEIRETIGDYKGQGYAVHGIEDVLDGDLDELEKLFIDFQSNIDALNELQKQVDAISPEGIKNELEALQKKLYDPFVLDEIQADLAKIEGLISTREEKREEYRTMLNEWRSLGYDVDRMEAELDSDLDAAMELIEGKRSEIDTLKVMNKELEEFDQRGFEKECSKLRATLADVDRLEDAKAQMEGLRGKIGEAVERRSSIKETVGRWKEEGFIIGALESILEGDLEVLEERTIEFEEAISKLYDFQERLSAIEGYDSKKKAITKKIHNPKMVEAVEKALVELEGAMEEEKQARQGIVDQIEAWKGEGFNVGILEGALEKGLDKARKAMEMLTEDIDKLKAFRELLSDLDVQHFREKANEVEELLSDPEKLSEAKEAIEDLNDLVDADREKRGELIAKLESWEGEGLNIAPLLDSINNDPMDQVDEAFEAFEGELEQLRKLQQKFGGGPGGPAGPAPAAAPAGEPAAKEGKGGEAPPAEGDEGEAPPDPVTDEEVIERMRTEGLNPDFSFKTFVVGGSNRFTQAASEAVSNNPAEAYNPLFIYGGSGLGKTHLITALAQRIMREKPHLAVLYVSSEKFTNDLIEAVRTDDIVSFRDLYRKADILLIDDIQFLEGKESTQEEFFHTFNSLYNSHKQIVVTSDRPPKEITTLEERLKSRFEGGLITEIQSPSLETRVIILRRMAKKMGLPISDELVHHIASIVTDNIRELEGVLTKVGAMHSLTKEDVTFGTVDDILKEIMSDYEGSEGPAEVTLVSPDAESEAPEAAGEEGAAPEAPAEEEAGADEGAPEDAAGAKAGGEEEEAEGRNGAGVSMEGIEARLSSLRNKLTPMMENVSKVRGEGEAGEKEAPVEVGGEEAPAQEEAPGEKAQEEEGAKEEAAPAGEEDEEYLEGEVELVKCGSCDALIASDSIECPECGVSFGGEWYECPECAATAVNSISMKCESCGAEFEIED